MDEALDAFAAWVDQVGVLTPSAAYGSLRSQERPDEESCASDNPLRCRHDKYLIVNPNTTASMTETIGAAARAVAAPGTEISAVTSAMGPVSIEGYYDEAFAVPGLIEALMNAPDADAAIVAASTTPASMPRGATASRWSAFARRRW